MTTVRDPYFRLIILGFLANVVAMEITLYPELFGVKIREDLPHDPFSAHLLLSLVPTIPLLLWRMNWIAKKAFFEKEKAEKEAQFLAFHDPLTGLGNRRHFSRMLEQFLGGGARPAVAVMLIDLDGFKAVNDAFGHDAGDAVLIVAADRLKRITNDQTICTRMGGDEFAIILTLPDPIDAEKVVSKVASEICRTLRQPITLDMFDTVVQVSASVGVALHSAVKDPDNLLRAADRAMYAAKADGKDDWRFAG